MPDYICTASERPFCDTGRLLAIKEDLCGIRSLESTSKRGIGPFPDTVYFAHKQCQESMGESYLLVRIYSVLYWFTVVVVHCDVKEDGTITLKKRRRYDHTGHRSGQMASTCWDCAAAPCIDCRDTSQRVGIE